MPFTHYIPAFTTVIRGQQLAACDTVTDMRSHSVEPTCPACQAYLTRTAEEDQETALALEAEFPEYKGRLVVER